MRITQPEPVTRTYCDECGRDVWKVGNAAYGRDGKDYCVDHKPWKFKDIVKSYALSQIKKQRFF